MKIKPGLLVKKINDFYAVVPMDQSHIDFQGMMTFNESAKILYDQLLEESTEDELEQLLLSKYDVDIELVKKDVSIFLNNLRKYNLLEE